MVPDRAASSRLTGACVLCRELASISGTSTPEGARNLRGGSAAGLQPGRRGFPHRQDPEGLPRSDGPLGDLLVPDLEDIGSKW